MDNMKTNLNIVKIIIYVSALCWALLAGAERIVWANVKSYPGVLVNKHISAPTEDELIQLRKSCREPLEIKRISTTTTAIRCGLLWPFMKVVIANSMKS